MEHATTTYLIQGSLSATRLHVSHIKNEPITEATHPPFLAFELEKKEKRNPLFSMFPLLRGKTSEFLLRTSLYIDLPSALVVILGIN